MNGITAYIERDPETKLYVGFVPGVPGAHTQAESLDELQADLKAVELFCVILDIMMKHWSDPRR